jgi:hypothetical protein
VKRAFNMEDLQRDRERVRKKMPPVLTGVKPGICLSVGGLERFRNCANFGRS